MNYNLVLSTQHTFGRMGHACMLAHQEISLLHVLKPLSTLAPCSKAAFWSQNRQIDGCHARGFAEFPARSTFYRVHISIAVGVLYTLQGKSWLRGPQCTLAQHKLSFIPFRTAGCCRAPGKPILYPRRQDKLASLWLIINGPFSSASCLVINDPQQVFPFDWKHKDCVEFD